MFLYIAESKEAEIKEKAKAAEIAKVKAQEAEKKKIAEEKARLDSAKRAAERAAEDAMQTMRKLMGKLRLKINPEKSAVAKAWERKFLGYRLWVGPKRIVKRAVAPQALAKFRQRVRELTSRTCGRSMKQIVERLDGYLVGWKGYFQLADTPKVFSELDSWIRRRLRMVYLKQWKRGTTCFERLRNLGVPKVSAATGSDGSRGYWYRAGTRGMNTAFPRSHFDALGLTRLGA
jgi:hypothetical protein